MGRTEGGVGRQLEAGSGENTAWVQPLLDPAGAAGNFALRAEYLQQLRAAACAQTPVAGRQCQMGWLLSCIFGFFSWHLSILVVIHLQLSLSKL